MELTMLMYLIPSLLMFACGVFGFITRRNLIAILISLELMLNSVDLNFVIFNRFLFPGELEGMFFTLLAIAIIINIFRSVKNIDVKDITKLKF